MKTMETTKHTPNTMPMNKVIGLIVLFVLTVNLFNCSKDDDGSQQSPEPTTMEKLMAGDGKWYFESPTHNDCYKKSFMRFLSGNTFIQEIYDLDGNDNCVVQSGGTDSGTYEVLSETEIYFTFSGSSDSTFTIVSLTKNELILQITANGATSTIVLDKTEG